MAEESALKLTALAIFLIASRVRRANIGAGDNSRYLAAICHLLQLAKGTPKQDADIPNSVASLNTLEDINMTIAGAAWQANFHDKGTKLSWGAAKQKNSKLSDNWQANWDGWAAAAERIRAADKKQKIYIEKEFSGLADYQLAAAKVKIAILLNRSDKIYDKIKVKKNAVDEASEQKVRQDLNKAAYGVPEGTGKYTNGQNNDNSIGNAATCGNGGKHNNIQTLVQTLLCLCRPHKTNKQDEACIKEKAVTLDYGGLNGDGAITHLGELLDFCSINAKAEVDAHAITAGLNQLKGLITVIGGTGYLGWTGTTPACTGQSDSGMCVAYASYVAAGDGKLSEIDWVKTLKAAAAKMKRMENAVEKWHTLDQALKDNEAAAWLIPSEVSLLNKPIGVSNKQTPGQAAAAAINSGCADHHNNKTECEKLQCSYDANAADGKKCKPKKDTETPAAAGTGNGAAVKCSDYGTKDKCEEVNKGKDKPVCGWRKGKDNEDAQDTSMIKTLVKK
ncbi:Trypanosome variant surface glycoprotein C-terminal domain containing protein [Trypanosoma brucei equiperdum]|uniref:Trypanosome variant surface glycoprotein C-terminal domain containing protein n=1 Tax=Trypanosoma brucei equiperdum TaxID=630700 RepID=A0A3L6L1E0_9TRYP|nr:Trypanosome variant surface glycoprotein C-terminal domain containing protein [Trypanosoma brucei equiperdum]